MLVLMGRFHCGEKIEIPKAAIPGVGYVCQGRGAQLFWKVGDEEVISWAPKDKAHTKGQKGTEARWGGRA